MQKKIYEIHKKCLEIKSVFSKPKHNLQAGNIPLNREFQHIRRIDLVLYFSGNFRFTNSKKFSQIQVKSRKKTVYYNKIPIINRSTLLQPVNSQLLCCKQNKSRHIVISEPRWAPRQKSRQCGLLELIHQKT